MRAPTPSPDLTFFSTLALKVTACWSIPSVTLSQPPGSHCCILTRSWSRRSLCLVLSEVRVPRIYWPGVADPSQAATPGSQSSWLSLYLGHSRLLLHAPLAVTDPLFSPRPLTVPARVCSRKHTLPRGSLPQFPRAPVPSDSFPAPRHRPAKSNRLRGDARETSDRTADRKSRLPPTHLSIPPRHP